MALRHRAAIAAALSGALAGCALLIGIRDETGVVQKPDPCIKHVPPGPSDAGSDGPGPLDPKAIRVFAMRTVIGIAPEGGTLGYDLDERCTGEPDSTTNTAPCTLTGEAPIQDGDGGIDNEFGALLQGVVLPGVDGGDVFGETVTKQIGGGNFTLLVYLTDYDGTANDPSVHATVILSGWLAATNCDTSAAPPADPTSAAHLTPHWDGCDVWSYVNGSDNVRLTPVPAVITSTNGSDSDRAYVADHVLVLTMNSLSVPFVSGTLVTLNDAILTARIESEADGGLALRDGIVTGRGEDTNVLNAVANVAIQHEQVCSTEGLVGVLQNLACPKRDLPPRKVLDGTDASCTAISVAFGFEAFPAVLGLVPVNQLDAACPPIDAACP